MLVDWSPRTYGIVSPCGQLLPWPNGEVCRIRHMSLSRHEEYVMPAAVMRGVVMRRGICIRVRMGRGARTLETVTAA